jgi:hypothetical protein
MYTHTHTHTHTQTYTQRSSYANRPFPISSCHCYVNLLKYFKNIKKKGIVYLDSFHENSGVYPYELVL